MADLSGSGLFVAARRLGYSALARMGLAGRPPAKSALPSAGPPPNWPVRAAT